MKRAMYVLTFVLVVMSANGFAQGTLTGTVEDVSSALIPGVTITATNTQTGVVTTRLTNESGAYDVPGLLPGVYRLSASLPGFQTKVFENIDLGAETKRFNFTLEVTTVNTQVEVIDDGAQVLATTGASVGEVLTAQKVVDLPMVTGDVLDLVRILPGVRLNPFGGEFDTFAGLSAGTVNTTRDGLSVTDGRYANGIFASTLINPDLVGEIRLILTPVDAELGRGNGQVQITTRSGTNRYTGAATWNVRNTALNANTWDNNNDTVVENGVRRWQPTQPDWSNENQVTVSYGGPIIRNKTFFFVLYDQQLRNQRSLVTATTLTDTARRGIYRYWEGWNNGNASQAPPSATGNTIAVVDEAGNPVVPYKAQGTADNANVPYTGSLRCVSVFGNRDIDGNILGDSDCLFNGIQGQWVLPPGAVLGGSAVPWDTRRPVFDPTGTIRKFLEAAPVANYFRAGDGLNTAGNRYLRGNNANQGFFGTVGLQTGTNINADRKQINIKIDQNFTANHKLSGGYTWETSGGSDFLGFWPNQYVGETRRLPQILTTNFTSTLSPTLLNEFRFGIRITKTESNPAWEHSDDRVRDGARAFMLTGAPLRWVNTNTQTAATPADVIFNPGAGIFAISGDNAPFDTNPSYLGNYNPLYNFADTVRWTKGTHALRFGGDINITRSNGYNFLPYNIPRLNGGAGNYPANSIDNTGANPLPGLQTASRDNLRNLLYLMSGSINSGSQGYWVDSAGDVDFDVPENGSWEDYVSAHRKYRDQRQNEFAAFFQDDWKVTRNLTLNLGARWAYFGVPYLKGGFTSAPIGWGNALSGVGGTGSGDVFDNWLYPGNVFLTGYGGSLAGQTAATALQCAPGTQAGIVSTCDPSRLVRLQFVGPDSPNPDLGVYKASKTDIGPVVGFAWQVPWFGEGKTTIRGGYSLSYGGSGRNGIALDGILGGAPGAVHTGNMVLQDFVDGMGTLRYLDLTNVSEIVPIRPTVNPGQTFSVYQKSGAFTAYQRDWETPYSQNFNLSVTRNLTNRVTLDVRYVGTKGRKLSGTINLNEVNVFNNPDLFDALETIRTGGESPLLDSMLAGVNLNPGVTGIGGTGPYTAIGTTNNAGVLQTAALHLRRWQGANLSRGNYEAIANSLNGNGPNGNTLLTALPTGVSAGSGGRLIRNGCDRLAIGAPIGTAPAGMVNTMSGPVPIQCFPENWISINPQLDDANYITNTGYSNYDSLQAQVSLRAWQGMSFSGTYTWSKTLALASSGWMDFRNRASDYGLSGQHLTHDFRANSNIELPVGPGKLFFGNSSGWVARLIERWQTSFIFNVYTGRPISITGTNAQSLWNAGLGAICPPNTPCTLPDVVGPWDVRGGSTEWGTIVTNTQTGDVGGTYFGFPSPYMKVPDPQCAVGGLVDVSDRMGYNLRGNNTGTGGAFVELCTLDALANAQTGQILLQNPRPGTRGSLHGYSMQTRGIWSLDMSASKSFSITESISAQIRIDATNALNHPTPPDPVLDINSNTDFGYMTGDKTGSRAFRGTLRLMF